MEDTSFCKHYRSMEHPTCNAGVAYESLKGIPFKERPCFMRFGKTFSGCNKMDMPTPEEIANEEREIEARIENIGKARQAIVAHLGGPWKRGMPSAADVIDCPACGQAKALQFRRAGYNGHIHARCTTEGCVSWME